MTLPFSDEAFAKYRPRLNGLGLDSAGQDAIIRTVINAMVCIIDALDAETPTEPDWLGTDADCDSRAACIPVELIDNPTVQFNRAAFPKAAESEET